MPSGLCVEIPRLAPIAIGIGSFLSREKNNKKQNDFKQKHTCYRWSIKPHPSPLMTNLFYFMRHRTLTVSKGEGVCAPFKNDL